ncbi:MAG: alpha-amylase [Chitinophagaceae bacterium]
MQNQTIFQFFHWYYSTEGNLWQYAREEAGRLQSLGVTQVWLPPAYKSAFGTGEPGYAVYDLYDLGEFDQKGSVRTRWGTLDEYLDAIQSFHDNNIKVLADIVLNHRTGADETEKIVVLDIDKSERTKFISEPYEKDACTRYTFPGRRGMYSEFVWDHQCFTGISEDDQISMIKNEYFTGEWEPVMETEHGNYDYLLGNDLEFRNPHVREELIRWGIWYVEKAGLDGFRLDAVKHMVPDFYNQWLDALNNHFQQKLLCIGEYWKSDVEPLKNYIEATGGRVQLFDAPLHFNFHEASRQGESYALNEILDGSLVKERPELAITFVENHDTQPLQDLESPVEAWFKPLAYAIILLRQEGTPCVFFPDLYGAQYVDNSEGQEHFIDLPALPVVGTMMTVRKERAYGVQTDYIDHHTVIGWTRAGVEEYPHSGCAVVISNGQEGFKRMSMGPANAGKKMIEACGSRQEEIILDEHGEADFHVNAGSVSVWIFDRPSAE